MCRFQSYHHHWHSYVPQDNADAPVRIFSLSIFSKIVFFPNYTRIFSAFSISTISCLKRKDFSAFVTANR